MSKFSEFRKKIIKKGFTPINIQRGEFDCEGCLAMFATSLNGSFLLVLRKDDKFLQETRNTGLEITMKTEVLKELIETGEYIEEIHLATPSRYVEEIEINGRKVTIKPFSRSNYMVNKRNEF